jgi:hypothetical protein
MMYMVLWGKPVYDKNSLGEEYFSVDRAKPFLDNKGKRVSEMMDPRLRGQYSLLVARNLAIIVNACNPDVCVISELKARVPPRRIERRIKIISLITFIITMGWFI